MTNMPVVRSELILGGQRSGKSRRAERLAQAWLADSPDHGAVFIATAQAWDDEMRERVARHRQDRAERLPGMATVEEPLHLAQAIAQHSRSNTLVVVDCLTLWLTNRLMPAERPDERAAENSRPTETPAHDLSADIAMISSAILGAAGPVVLVSNEIGLGVIPMGRETRAFVDALGWLNQDVAGACERVTLMAAGLPLTLKGSP